MKTFLIYALVGAVCILLGILSCRKEKARMARCVTPASARIVEVIEERDKSDSDESSGRDRIYYTPVYEYTANGKTVRKAANIATSGKNDYHVGDVVEMRYNPEKPEEFVVEGKRKNAGMLFGVVLILVGIIIIAIASTQL